MLYRKNVVNSVDVRNAYGRKVAGPFLFDLSRISLFAVILNNFRNTLIDDSIRRFSGITRNTLAKQRNDLVRTENRFHMSNVSHILVIDTFNTHKRNGGDLAIAWFDDNS